MTHFHCKSTSGIGWRRDHYLLDAFTFLLLCSHAFTSGVDSGVGFVWSMVYISFPCFQSWYLSGWNFFTKISIEIFTMSFLQVHWNTKGLLHIKHFTSYIKSQSSTLNIMYMNIYSPCNWGCFIFSNIQWGINWFFSEWRWEPACSHLQMVK